MNETKTQLTIKKTRSKDFHAGNRLNGDGGKLAATYGVFDGATQVGFLTHTGSLWDAWDYSGNRLNSYSSSLSQMRKQLAK